MAVETGTFQVVMPAMGDSVVEGTVLEWHKQEGDPIEADETLVEISTDKVDAEVPSPVSGTIVKLYAAEGDTVGVGARWPRSRSARTARTAPTAAAAASAAGGAAPSAERPPRSSTSSPLPAVRASPRERSSSGR